MVWLLMGLLYPKTESSPNPNENTITIRQLVSLFKPKRSHMIETTVSIREIEDVRAASATRMKT